MSHFKVVRKNLIHARAVIRQYGKCFLHADGNIYINAEDSGFRKDFSNPNADGTPSAASYVLELKRVEDVPTSVADAEAAFFRAKNQEQKDNAQKTKSIALVKTFNIDESDEDGIEPDDEEEFKPANAGQLAEIPKAKVVEPEKPPPPPPPAAKTPQAPAGKGQTQAAVGNKGTAGNKGNTGNKPPVKIDPKKDVPPPPPPAAKEPQAEGFTILDKGDVSKGSDGVEI